MLRIMCLGQASIDVSAAVSRGLGSLMSMSSSVAFAAQLPQDSVAYVMARASSDALAVLLYGSVARGSATSDSDIDVLELVDSEPVARADGVANFTQYTPGHLRRMMEGGSLFALHIATEGVILTDPDGVLRRLLLCYGGLPDSRLLKGRLAVAAGVLNGEVGDGKDFATGLGKLMIYLLRTATYLAVADVGQARFDTRAVAEALGDERVYEVLLLRKRGSLTFDDAIRLYEVLLAYIPAPPVNETGSVTGYAVVASHDAYVASLMTGVLLGGRGIDYVDLAMSLQ